VVNVVKEYVPLIYEIIIAHLSLIIKFTVMFNKFPFWLVLLILSTASIPSHLSVKTIATNNNRFAFDLYQQVRDQNEGNIFFSPFSISTALAMTYAGANGSTADEMKSALHFSPNSPDFHYGYGAYIKALEKNAKGNIELNIANRLWGETSYKLHDDFVALNKKAYDSPLVKVNYKGNPDGSRQEINKWVEEQTKDKIKDLLAPGTISSDTRLVLANAIYFKGDWKHKFDEKRTKEMKFNLEDGNTVKADFMYYKGGVNYHETKNYKMIRLPYKGNMQSMIVVLPHKAEMMKEVENHMSTSLVQNAMIYYAQPEVIVKLPKFKMTLGMGLNKLLQNLGMKNAFSAIADFSKMTPSNDLYISDVVHKAFIEIDEEGTEAAAATAVVMTTTSVSNSRPPKPKEFIADHPFLFYIVDNKTSSILFMGRIMNPKK
jgi:serpin B